MLQRLRDTLAASWHHANEITFLIQAENPGLSTPNVNMISSVCVYCGWVLTSVATQHGLQPLGNLLCYIRFAPVCLKTPSCEVVSSSKLSHLRRICTSRSLLTIPLVLFAGDVEVNPGPIKYPCTSCGKAVNKNQRGIVCDTCEKWTHASCCGINISK